MRRPCGLNETLRCAPLKSKDVAIVFYSLPVVVVQLIDFEPQRRQERKDNCLLLINHYSLFRGSTIPPAKLSRWDKHTG